GQTSISLEKPLTVFSIHELNDKWYPLMTFTVQNFLMRHRALHQDEHYLAYVVEEASYMLKHPAGGSGSLEKDSSPVSIIAMQKEEKARLVYDLRLGKGERNAHKTGEALAQRAIPALHMSGLSRLFAYSRVVLFGNHTTIDFQKVGKAMALAILLRN